MDTTVFLLLAVPVGAFVATLLYCLLRQYVWPYTGHEQQQQNRTTPNGVAEDDPDQFSHRTECTWLYDKIVERCSDEKFYVSSVWKRDLLLYVAVIFPALAGVGYACSAAYAVIMDVQGAGTAGTAAIISLFLALIIWAGCFIQAPPDALVVRFLFRRRMFHNCLVFSLRPFNTIAFFPGSQNVLTTSLEPGPHQVTVQLCQGTPPANLVGMPYDKRPPVPTGKSDAQVIVLHLVYHLGIWQLPLTCVRCYYQEFLQNNGESAHDATVRAFRQIVQPQILETVVARADSVLQRFYLEEMFGQIDMVNQTLLHTFGRALWTVGVMLDQISVEHVDDVNAGGAVAQRSAANRAERESEARVRQVAANETATMVRLAASKRIAVANIVTLKKQREAAMWQAKTDLEPLKMELALLAAENNSAAMVLRKLNQIPEAAMPELVAALQRVYKPGGNLFVMEGGGKSSPTDEILGKIAAIVQNSLPTGGPTPPAPSAGSNP